MFRSYWGIILALIGALVLVSGATSQNRAEVTGGGVEIQRKADRSADQKESNAANAVTPADLENREQAVQPDCGTPKECRAEQRDQDDLIAQQAMVKAAASQRTATWWQTGIGAAGVLLLILTVVYTHWATKAAINSVNTLIAVERARVAIPEKGVITTTDGKTGVFTLWLRNTGRSVGALREYCVMGSATGMFKDFRPTNPRKHNKHIPTERYTKFGTYEFELGAEDHRFIVGYYKYSTIFSSKLVTDYFCFEVGSPEVPLELPLVSASDEPAVVEAEPPTDAEKPRKVRRKKPPPVGDKRSKDVPVDVLYRTDLDWPPDQD